MHEYRNQRKSYILERSKYIQMKVSHHYTLHVSVISKDRANDTNYEMLWSPLNNLFRLRSNSLLLHMMAIALHELSVLDATNVVWVEFWRSGNLTSELFESLALGLWNEERGEDTAQHEEGEDLHDVVDPWGRIGGSGTTGSEWSNKSLGNDRSDLASGGGYSM